MFRIQLLTCLNSSLEALINGLLSNLTKIKLTSFLVSKIKGGMRYHRFSRNKEGGVEVKQSVCEILIFMLFKGKKDKIINSK